MDNPTPRSPGAPPRGAALAGCSLTDVLDQRAMRLHSRSVMVALSHLIEDHAALTGPETVLVAAFQRLALYGQELGRYRHLARHLGQIYVLGVPDVAPPELPGVQVLALEPSWPLAQEWAVVASGPACCVALLARDAEGFRLGQRSRAFHGLWTTDAAVVDGAVASVYAALGQPAPTFARDTLAVLRNTQEIQRALAARLRGA